MMTQSHFVMPGASVTLCAEPTTTAWETAPGLNSRVTCGECRAQRRWLPASGELERDPELEVMVEPWLAGQRRHVTGNDDPERGRLHRPPNLQLCVDCCGLRGPYDGFDNLCRCDDRAWDRLPIPRCGDLHNNAHLCRSCISALAPGCSRWTFYYCEACRPHVARLNRLSGRCVVPIGPHSMMNRVVHTAGDGPDVDAQAVAFADQLSTLFQNQTTLHELTVQRTRTRLTDFGIDDHAVVVDDYFDLCRADGWDTERGFADFMLSIGEARDLHAEG
jgi:hypothetical protein